MKEPQMSNPSRNQSKEVEALQKRVGELEVQLRQVEIKAEFYDEMISVAEAKFKIPIRKKAGAKQYSTCMQGIVHATASKSFADWLA